MGASSGVYGIVNSCHSGGRSSRWWNEEDKLAVRKKKSLYKKFLDTDTDEVKRQYNEAKTEAKRVVGKAKNEEWMRLGRELEKDAWGNQRRFWDSGNGNKKERDGMSRICSRDGSILMEEEEVKERWKEHFERLYREVNGSGQPTLCRRIPLEEDGSEILEEEVRRGVLRLKVRKAAGICGIMLEMLEAGGQILVEWLTKLFN